jgi:hypothetical protein
LRATRAYITGFGTTGLLIAAAFMTLFVMSAYVAFNGFPGQDVENPIGKLVLQEQPAPVSVPAQPVQVHVRGATRGPSSAHHHGVGAKRAVGPTASTGPVVKRRLSSGAPSSQAPASGSVQAPPPDPVGRSLPAPPQVPTGVLPQLPNVSLPAIEAPGESSPPVDTSGLTNAASGLVGG